MRIRIVLGLVLAFVLSSPTFKSTSASNSSPYVFYAVSQNHNTFHTTLWEIDSGANTAYPIMEVNPINDSPLSDQLSSRELDELRNAVAQGSFMTIADGVPEHIRESIDAAWLIDSNQILVKTRHEVCDDFSWVCYGYFEGSSAFLVMDCEPEKRTRIRSKSKFARPYI